MSEEKVEESQKLEELEAQIGEMKNGFEEMKKSREGDNKLLGEQIGDVHMKLAECKAAQEAEITRIDNLLKALEKNFNVSLKKIKEDLHKEMEDEKKFVRDKFAQYEKKLNGLEKKWEQEKKEIIIKNNENLKNIQNKFTNLEKAYKQEKTNREENENEIKANINKNVKELNTKLEDEKNDRNKNIKTLKESFMNELDKRDKSLVDLQNKNANDLKMLKEEVYSELENRFDHQNQIVSNISIFMKSFQEALSIMGKDF